MQSTNFDIAIIGAGAAGLHLALAIGKDPFFAKEISCAALHQGT